MPDGNILDLIPEIVKGDAQNTKVIVLIKERSTKSDEVANMYKQVQCVEFSYDDFGLSQETANNIREVIRTVFDEKSKAAQNAALKDRKDDIPELAADFVKIYSEKVNKHPKLIDPDTLDYLIDYDWPQDVQELEDVINIACEASTAANSEIIEPHHLPTKVRFYDPSVNLPAVNINIADEEDSIVQDSTYNGLIKKGAYWEVTFKGHKKLIKDSLGLLSIAFIIQNKGKPISSVELAQIISGTIADGDQNKMLANDLKIEGTQRIFTRADRVAIENYKETLNRYQDNIDNAENQEDKIIKKEELSKFIDGLHKAGIKVIKTEYGYDLEASIEKGSSGERARKATYGNISHAIDDIREKHHWKELADYLNKSIKKGYKKSYTGDLIWDIQFNL